MPIIVSEIALVSSEVGVLSRVVACFAVVCKKFTLEKVIEKLVCWLCWGLTSQSTIFQSCRDGAIASWVINQYFRGVKCLAQGHNTAAVGFEPRTSRSGVRHSTTEPPRSPYREIKWLLVCCNSGFILILESWGKCKLSKSTWYPFQ